MLKAVAKRLRADVPVGAYLSGGVDSSAIVALSCHLKGPAINTYTIRVDAPELDELSAASLAARHIGAKPPIVQEFRTEDALSTYPRLIQAAEAPVIDTSCAALLMLAQRVHSCGQKVVLTGEGADEWLIGYPWYKAAKLLGFLDIVPGVRLSDLARRAYLRLHGVPQFPPGMQAAHRGIHWRTERVDRRLRLARALKTSLLRAADARSARADQPWSELQLDVERARRWHPLNRGHLGRSARHAGRTPASGQRRSRGHALLGRGALSIPRRGRLYLSRQAAPTMEAARVPRQASVAPPRRAMAAAAVYRRSKVIFRAPLDSFHIDPEPAFVGQLLSEESLQAHRLFRCCGGPSLAARFPADAAGSLPRISVEMGLAAVVATQFWHHLYIDGTLADLPTWTGLRLASKDGSLRIGDYWSLAKVSCPRRFVSGSSFSRFGIASPFSMNRRASAVFPICA